MDREMLERWSHALPDRMVIEEFWDWLNAQFEQRMNERDECYPYFGDIDLMAELNKFQKIDVEKLEEERRLLALSLTTDTSQAPTEREEGD